MDVSADANLLIGSQAQAASGQHDPDSITTHITETQFTQGANLEMETLSDIASDEHHELYVDGNTNSKSMVNEYVTPRTDLLPPAIAQSVHEAGKHVGRLEVEKGEPPCAFSFGKAPSITLNIARRIGPSQPQASRKCDFDSKPGTQC